MTRPNTYKDENKIVELLLQWEELSEEGQDVSAEELCQDYPQLIEELARRIHALKAMEWVKKPMDGDDDGPLVEAPEPPPEPLAGRYRLDHFVAEGGFGQVWQGLDLELQRKVAIKLPKPERLSPDQTEKFVAEARRVARLRHPGIVPVYDVGRDEELCLIVSDFVEGGTLADRIWAGQLTSEEATLLIADIAGTLDYAHREGFVHRDIKPSNILLDHHGRALLTDFGIAVTLEELAGEEHRSLGTLAYMSPEQIEGKSVDHRTDIYSLGVVLFESLTGRLPFDEPNPPRLRARVVAGEPADFSASGIPPGLAQICRKCLARNSNDRYTDAGALAGDLRSWRPSRSRRWGGILAIAAVSVIVIAFSIWYRPVLDRPVALEQNTDKFKPSLPATSPADSAEAALALGKLHFNNREFDQAAEAFVDVIGIAPDSSEAHHRLAGALFNSGKLRESLPHFDRAAELDPTNPEILQNRAITWMNLGEFENALADLEIAFDLDPGKPASYRKLMAKVHVSRAVEHSKEKRWDEAIAEMTLAIDNDPANAEYQDKRGSLHFNAQEFEKATVDFDEAIRLVPDERSYRLHRGYALAALEREEEAQRDFEEASRLNTGRNYRPR